MAQAKRKEKKAAPEAPGSEPSAGPAASPTAWSRPVPMGKKGWAVLVGAVLLINLPVIHHFLRSPLRADQSIPFSDSFDTDATLPAHYFTTGVYWRTRNGHLLSPGVKNNPLWVRAKLPHNVRVDFDATALSPQGDVRVEIFGDGVDHLSGYELVQGGWGNTRSAIARLDENAPDLVELKGRAQSVARKRHLASADLVKTGVFEADTAVKVERNGGAVKDQSYHWTIERRGRVLRWSLNGQPFLELDDPFPLYGAWNDRFGLSSAGGDVLYDNLKITPLDASPFPAGSSPVRPVFRGAPGPFSDDFGRETLGSAWNPTDPTAVRIDDGAVAIQNGHNHPLWLTHPIPQNAAIEFDAWSDSPDGDLKVEAWGDGRSYYQGDLRLAYTATGYVFIFGGWHNTLSAIARQHEHGEDRITRSDFRVEPGHHYHWRITRQGGKITWEIDGKVFLKMNDRHPLNGPTHQFFAFSDWEAPVHFDNLHIEPL